MTVKCNDCRNRIFTLDITVWQNKSSKNNTNIHSSIANIEYNKRLQRFHVLTLNQGWRRHSVALGLLGEGKYVYEEEEGL